MLNQKANKMDLPHNEQLFKHFINDDFLTSGELELYFPGVNCSASCDYCYLKNNKFLYEVEDFKITNEALLNNCKKILYFIKQKEFSGRLELFGAELFFTEYWKELFDLLLFELNNYNKIDKIVIPTNGTFIKDKNKTQLIEDYLIKFKNINIDIYLSFSIDGKYVDDRRSLMSDNDYQNLLKLSRKYNFGFHPVVYSKALDNWIDNIDWWFDFADELNDKISARIVRNHEWDNDDFIKLEKYYSYLMDKIFEFSNNDAHEAYLNLFKNDFMVTKRLFNFNFENNIGGFNCGVGKRMCLRVADLNIFACHRLAYNDLSYGEIVLNEDGELLDVIPKNLHYMFTINSLNPKNVPKCTDCVFSPFCLKGCLGSQYEHSKITMLPIETVCSANKIIIMTVILKMYELGILTCLLEDIEMSNEVKNKYIKIIHQIQQGEY